MIFPMKYTHLGYDYLDRVNLYQLHSGVDFNWGRPDDDLGLPINSIANGEVVFSKDTGKGWGNLVVIYHPAYGVWSRYAHLLNNLVSVGQKVKEGDLIGHCGATGGNWKPHLHFDIIRKELKSWTSYTSFMSADAVREYYVDPVKYIELIQAEENAIPEIVKWNKKHKLIEHWSTPPTAEELKLGWVAYKISKEIVNGNLNKDSFTL